MITDTIKNRNLYAAISPRIKAALDYLADTDFSGVEPGRYEIDGQNLYVMVQQYDTIPKEQAKWECHRNYIDIQFIVEGVEQIGFSNVENMKILVEYDPVKDIEILTGDGDYVTLDRGSFGIFFPQDAHQPKVAPDNISG
ncbi:MAG TPA: YhcH/YjgK/YiaL family protein, partial [Bacteroidales bacterium]|nr:YhcH/YjgK/YiaL family protein [Bacteroidales bacterium]